MSTSPSIDNNDEQQSNSSEKHESQEHSASPTTSGSQQDSPSSEVFSSPTLETETSPLNIAETNMIHGINSAIRRLLNRPNHQPPYTAVFRWTVNDESSAHYSVTITINELRVQN